MTDETIVALYWARNEDALRETTRKYGAYLTKVAYNILSNREDSEECVNDTYWKAWSAMPTDRPARLTGYLSRITRQTAIDLFRKKNAVKRYASEYSLSLEELGDCFPDGRSIDRQLDAALLDEAIDHFLRTLPQQTRTAFIGRYYFFDPLKEVAAYCGMTESKLKSLMFRTRQSLKCFLEKEGFDL